MKNNSISKIALKIGKDISENYYGNFSTIDKNANFLYYLVKWTSDRYTFLSYHKIGKYFIKAGELVYYAAYLKPLSNFKKLFTPY